jgi:hypothetical protein
VADPPSWRAGQVIASPRYVGGSCPSFFGLALEGSGLPPYGSGGIFLFGSDGSQLVALYSPLFFVVTPLLGEGCALFFDRPALNHRSNGLMAKVILDGKPTGFSCPQSEFSDCYRSYWTMSNTFTGVLGLVDTGRGNCPAFFASVTEGSTVQEGSFFMTHMAIGGTVMPSPSTEFSGQYSSEGLVLRTPGCSSKFIVSARPAAALFPSPIAFPFPAATLGSAKDIARSAISLVTLQTHSFQGVC